MTDLIAPLGEIASAVLPVVIIVRRGWYGIACAAGYAQAAQSGQTPSSAEAFAMGRSVVIQTVSSFAMLRLHQIDWRGVAAGADHAVREWRLHARIAWKGMKHDARKAWHSLDRLHVLIRPELQVARERQARIEAAKDPIEQQHLSALISVQTSPEPTLDQRLMGAQTEHNLAEMGRPVNGPVLPLLSVAANPFLMQARLYALGAAGVAILGGVGWAFHEHHEAQKARQWSADNKALREDLKDRDDRVKTLRVQVTQQNVLCVQDQIRASDLRAKQDTRAKVATLRARKHIDAASAPTAVVFNLDRALAELREPAGETPATSSGGSAPASDLAGGVRGPDASDAGGPGGVGKAETSSANGQ